MVSLTVQLTKDEYALIRTALDLAQKPCADSKEFQTAHAMEILRDRISRFTDQGGCVITETA